MVIVASKTGWTEEYIRWELPLSRGHSYYHSSRLLDGVGMQWPETRQKIDDYVDDVKNGIRKRGQDKRRGLTKEGRA